MKISKIRIFKGYSSSALDREIQKWEDDGWEVIEHKLDVTSYDTFRYTVSVLFQKDSSVW